MKIPPKRSLHRLTQSFLSSHSSLPSDTKMSASWGSDSLFSLFLFGIFFSHTLLVRREFPWKNQKPPVPIVAVVKARKEPLLTFKSSFCRTGIHLCFLCVCLNTGIISPPAIFCQYRIYKIL